MNKNRQETTKATHLNEGVFVVGHGFLKAE